MNKKELFLNTIKGGVYKKKPIWFMRQAGRFLKSYRLLREKYDFLTMCTTPELASVVTMQPLKELDVDAMILFSDILIPLKALGACLSFKDGTSPVVENLDIKNIPNRTTDLNKVSFVYDTVKNIKEDVKDVALIGFAAAPFTLGCYVFGSGNDFYKIRSFIYEYPREFLDIMEALTKLTLEYINMQIQAGVDTVQLFDSWAGILPKEIYESFVYPFNKKIAEKLNIPSVYFVKNSTHINDIVATLGFDCLSVDWREHLPTIHSKTKRCVQGNLDNTLLLTNKKILVENTVKLLDATKNIPHILNLGHGVLPQTNPEVVKYLVDFVHSLE